MNSHLHLVLAASAAVEVVALVALAASVSTAVGLREPAPGVPDKEQILISNH